MANTKYNSTSIYFKTQQTSWYLDLMTYRPIPADGTDYLWQVTAKYNERPELAAHDLFGSSDLFWVFRVRNPSLIEDLVYDFTSGTYLMVPTKLRLSKILGN